MNKVLNETNRIANIDKLNSKIKETRSLIASETNPKLLKKFDEAVTKSESKLSSFWSKLSTTSGALNGIISFSAIKMAIGTISNAFGKIMDVTKESSAYIENLHLFEVSMGKAFEEVADENGDSYKKLDKEASKYYLRGIKFQNELHEKFGTNMSDTLKFQGLFNQMAKSMEIPEEQAYLLSENFTKLGYDLSSLYNIEPSAAMQKLRAGLAGQTKPLRDLGLDITQQSLAPKLQELGIDRSVKQLSQAENMVLRYIVVLEQAEAAHGDFADTIETPANQLKVLSEQLKELAIAIGNMFLPMLANVLPYINGFVMALKEVIQYIAVFFGYTEDLSKGMSSLVSDEQVDLGFEDELDDAKKLKNFTLGFDELNVLKPNEDSSTSDLGGVDPRLLEAMEGYDNMMEGVTMKATLIRDSIMEWLGFIKIVDEETGKISWNLEDGYTNLEKIKDVLLVIAGIKVATGIIGLVNVIKGSGLFKLISSLMIWFWNLGKAIVLAIGGNSAAKSAITYMLSPLKKILGVVAAVISIFLYFKQIKAVLDEGTFSLKSMLKVIGAIGGAIAGVALIFGAIPALIVGLIGAIGLLATTIYTYWDEIVTKIKVGLNWLGSKIMIGLATIGEKAVEVGTNFAYHFKRGWLIIFDWFVTGFENAILFISKHVENLINGIISGINKIIEFFGGEGFKKLDVVGQLETKYSDKQENRDNQISALEEERAAKISELNASLEKVVASFEKQQKQNEWEIYENYLNNKTEEELAKLKETQQKDKEFINNLVESMPWNKKEEKETEQNVATEEIATSTKETTGILKEIQSTLNILNEEETQATISDSELAENEAEFNELLKINNLANDDSLKISEDISSGIDLGNDLSLGTNTGITSILEVLKNEILNKLNQIKIACENIRINIVNNYYSNSNGETKGYATGGMPQSASLFYAHENGMPELVGKLGNNTAVMNNEQIVQAVAIGVANAVSEVMQKQKNKTVIQIDGKTILTATEKAKQSRGYGIVGGAFAKG